MKYREGPLAKDLSGSVGDSTFSSGRAGNYIRRRVDPAQPRTPAQTGARQRFSDASATWRSLTDVQRAGWRSLASTVTLTGRYGNLFKPTGQQLFVGLNTVLGIDGDNLDDAPGTFNTPPPTGQLVIIAKQGANAAADVLTVNVGLVPAGSKVLLFATKQFSQGREFISPSDFRLIKSLQNAQTNSVQSVKTEYEAKFGRLSTGSKLAMKAVSYGTSGEQAQPTIRTAIVVPV